MQAKDQRVLSDAVLILILYRTRANSIMLTYQAKAANCRVYEVRFHLS